MAKSSPGLLRAHCHLSLVQPEAAGTEAIAFRHAER